MFLMGFSSVIMQPLEMSRRKSQYAQRSNGQVNVVDIVSMSGYTHNVENALMLDGLTAHSIFYRDRRRRRAETNSVNLTYMTGKRSSIRFQLQGFAPRKCIRIAQLSPNNEAR